VGGGLDPRPPRPRCGRGEGVAVSRMDADALQEARLYAEAIVNTVREPLLVLDAHLCVHSINQPFSDLFLVSGAEVLGRPLRGLDKGVWEIPELLAGLEAVLKSGVAMDDFEVPYRSVNLGTRALLLSARPLIRGDGRSDLILVAIDDVTERRRIEVLLRENEARLREEERVRQRQLELASALRVSTVGELATGLAHELNQPLSSISMGVEACAQHLRSGVLDPARHLAILADIAGEAVRAADIISHLRSFVDKGEPRLDDVDLLDIAGCVPHLMLKELESSRVALEIDFPAEPLPVRADRIQIEQVLVNLIHNAAQSIQEVDGPVRRIVLGALAAGEMAEVRVRDTGTGVSEPAAEKMFQAFFTTKTHGLGMGLALSRSILEAHQGRIWMEAPSDGGAGIVVCFTIPLRLQDRPRGEGIA
jgi:signal transduction histidine kinase